MSFAVCSHPTGSPPAYPRMNTKRRGASLELRLKKQLEAMGFIIEKARAVYAGKNRAVSHDFYSAFDMVAKRAGTRTTWIQATTTNVSIAQKAAQIAEALPYFDQQFDDVWIARWQTPKPGQRGQWRIVRWDDGFDPKRTHLLSSADDVLPWENTP